jgi:hypothetical protein
MDWIRFAEYSANIFAERSDRKWTPGEKEGGYFFAFNDRTKFRSLDQLEKWPMLVITSCHNACLEAREALEGVLKQELDQQEWDSLYQCLEWMSPEPSEEEERPEDMWFGPSSDVYLVVSNPAFQKDLPFDKLLKFVSLDKEKVVKHVKEMREDTSWDPVDPDHMNFVVFRYRLGDIKQLGHAQVLFRVHEEEMN